MQQAAEASPMLLLDTSNVLVSGTQKELPTAQGRQPSEIVARPNRRSV